jgi:hypothetical protein
MSIFRYVRSFVLVVGCIVLVVFFSGSSLATALSGSQFQPGRIINDYVFTNSSSLSTSQIQAFLENKVKSCDTDGSERSPYGGTNASYGTSRGYPPPYVCLKSYRENPTIPTGSGEPWWDNGRTNLQGATVNPNGDLSAAQIIKRAADEYRISPKVILVILQKETSLVTDTVPWPSQYRKAMGYACPDTAACHPAYRGFYNQVTSAAQQLRRYLDYPENYNHAVGNTFVRYHPNSSCGGTVVNIKTASTAALYNYTPYQPNKAALDNLYGTGNSCSSYGNRNFWRLYNDWFGSTLVNPPPDKAVVGDWNKDGKDEIGIRRSNEYLLDNNNDGIANSIFGWGKITDKQLVGDWDGDGVTEVGLRRGNWYFLDTNNDGRSNYSFGFGRESDVALVGDWNGDGKDTIGLKRGNDYYYDNNQDGKADVAFGIGKSTDVALVGDWNGDGKDTIGLKRGNDYYLDNNNDHLGDFNFGIGKSTDVALVGDWNGDGKDTIGLRRATNYYLENTNDSVVEAQFNFGRATDIVLVGDWDGDNRYEIGLKRDNRYIYDHNNDGHADVSFYFGYF